MSNLNVYDSTGKPLEIERKYLVKMPDMNIVQKCEGYQKSHIEQLYLDKPAEGRIRKREYSDKCVCYHTVKQDVTDVSRIEVEKEISQSEYERLSAYIRPNTKIIHKTRHCFLYKGQLFELDVFDNIEGLVLLEIELQNEKQKIDFPDFIKITAEVTHDKRFRNFSLASSDFCLLDFI